LEYLKGMANLRSLALGSTQVADAGLQRLKELNRLERLRLSTTQVTDAGLVHLKGLTGREMLDMRFLPFVTDSEVRALEEALPNCEIRH
jgi:hypothetical protein